MSKRLFKKMSVKFKVLIIPLIILFFIVSVLLITTSVISKDKLMYQMEVDGVNLAEQVVIQLEKNNEALEIINNSIEDKIRNLGYFLSDKSSNEVNNDYLIDLAKKFNVDEINIINQNGKVEYSNLQTSLGSVYDKDHKAYMVLSGQNDEFMEAIRKSMETEDYFKYGYVKKSDGGVIQIGIKANKVYELREKLEPQALMSKLAEDENIVYACFIDKDLKAIAHSNPERVGITLTDEGSKTAAVDGKQYINDYYYEVTNERVYDVLLPVYKNDVHIGAVDVGLSMKNVYDTISKVRNLIIFISFISFMIAAAILYFIANSIVKGVKSSSFHLELMAKGDLSENIPAKSLNNKDEIGIMLNSLDVMQKSIRKIIESIKNNSNSIESQSENLSAISEEMSASAENVANAIQDAARGASSQAEDLLYTNGILNQFNENLRNITMLITDIDSSSKGIHDMANQSSGNMQTMEESLHKLNYSFEDLISKVSIVGTNVNQVNEITNLLNSIAEQTNLLALNAAIEAARAGEAGKGFAVVAEEIRKLAEQSKISSENINNIVKNISSDTEKMIETTQIVKKELLNQKDSIDITVVSFKNIIEELNKMNPKVNEVNNLTLSIDNEKTDIIRKIEEASSVAKEISATSEEIAATSEEMSASTEEVASTAQLLTKMTKDMTEEVNKFKL